MKVKITILLSICFILVGLVSADEIDVYPGTDQISTAMANAWPGDVLVLHGGEYTETATVVTIVGGVTIKGAEGEEVIWNTPDTTGGINAAIYVMGNLRVENIIFRAGNDDNRTLDCIRNQFGNVAEGEEPAAEKNNIFIDNCMFLRFAEVSINVHDEDDPVYHPVDTLYVTNCLIYGGYLGSEMGIQVRYGQAKEVKVQNSTVWRIDNDAIKIYGHETQLDYLHVLVDHCTVYDGASAKNPLGDEATGTLCYYMDGDDAIQNNIYYQISDFGFKSKKGNFLAATYDYLLADSIGWGCDVCAPWYYDVVDGGALGVNNIIADPMFNDPDAGDFSLKPGSLAIASASDGTDRGNPIADWTRAVALAGDPTGIGEKGSHLIREFVLEQNYPNPFNPVTTIHYAIPTTQHVMIKVFDITGRELVSLVDEQKNSGRHTIHFDGSLLPSGVYFYRITAGIHSQTKKLTLLK